MKLTRREFTGIIGGTAAALALPKSVFAAKKVVVGAHIWVYSAHQKDFDATPIMEQVFKELSTADIEGVELMEKNLLHDDSVARLGALSRQFQLPVLGTSWSSNMWNKDEHEKIIAEGRTIISRLSELGGYTLGITTGDAKRRKTDAELDAQADVLREVMAICKQHKVVPNLHNHTWEVTDGEYELRNNMRRVPDIGLGPDLDWLYKAGVDPVDFIKRNHERIIFCHLRNRKADGTWPEDMTEGVIDYATIGKLLHQYNFKGNLNIELAHEWKFQPTRPLGASVKISRAYVRRVMGY